MRRFSLIFLFIHLVALLFAQNGWTPESMIRFKRLGTTRLSPDGKLVAYTVSTPLMEGDKSEYTSQIWVASTDGKKNIQFTQSDKSCMNPSFSPDGKYLAFLSSRGMDKAAQLYFIHINGGEAEQITKSKSGIEAYAWSPDSKQIAFVQRDPDSDQEEKLKKEKRDWTLVDHWKYNHLYTISIDKKSRSERQIHRLTRGDFQVISFDWSPDAKSIVFCHQRTPSADEWPTSDISIVPSDSGAVRQLVAMSGFDGTPIYAPDGQSIAFTSDGGHPQWGGLADVYVIPSSGGTAKKLAETNDRQANLINWSGDGKDLFYNETDHTTNRVFRLPLNGTPVPVTTGTGNFSGTSVSADGKTLSFIFQTCDEAPEVFFSSTVQWAPKKISDANPDFPKFPMGKSEVIHWTSTDGKSVEGILTYPVNYKAGKKCPLVLNIHGGPAGVFTQTFTAAGSVYPIQAFAQQGYAVLRPNPRGSSGYGKEFRMANYEDWGFGDFDDDMTGVDKVIAMGIAHPDSLVICGWSYGGYMTSFAITRTDRFKAASVGAGVTNLLSFVGTSDIHGFIPDYFGGEYWNQLDAYIKHSAIFNMKNIKTPAQVIHGERDLRVPISQGFEFYTALKRLGIPTEMISYPRTPHGVQEPKFIQDIGERVIFWFNKELKRNGFGAVANRSTTH